MMAMRKEDDKTTRSADPTDEGDDDGDHLPARSPQSRALRNAPQKGLQIAVERGADVYFSACRRIARLLNRN